MILPHNEKLAHLIIADANERVHHVKTKRTLCELMARFWIVKGLRAVRAYRESCMQCRRDHSQPLQQQMASLLADRTTPYLPPFTQVRVDYFGPLYVTVWRRDEKRYGCKFTCLVTRGIHTQVAWILDADSFLMAYRRFVSRRGSPSKIYSDNGTNFIAGRKEIREGASRMAYQKASSLRSPPVSVYSSDDVAGEEIE